MSAIPVLPRSSSVLVPSCALADVMPHRLPQLATLVLWVVCAAVDGVGFIPVRTPASRKPAATQETLAEILHVELTSDPLPSQAPLTTPLDAVPVPAPPAAVQAAPSAPALLAVAEPSPAIAFALPTEGPVRVVSVEAASPVSVAASVVQSNVTTNGIPGVTGHREGATGVAGPPVQSLNYGHGEGRQPAPHYPPRARTAGQQGTVIVQFTVAPDGRVSSAESRSPGAWPLLQEAALRTVRERWRFRPGGGRAYEVAIRFELGK